MLPGQVIGSLIGSWVERRYEFTWFVAALISSSIAVLLWPVLWPVIFGLSAATLSLVGLALLVLSIPQIIANRLIKNSPEGSRALRAFLASFLVLPWAWAVWIMFGSPIP